MYVWVPSSSSFRVSSGIQEIVNVLISIATFHSLSLFVADKDLFFDVVKQSPHAVIWRYGRESEQYLSAVKRSPDHPRL